MLTNLARAAGELVVVALLAACGKYNATDVGKINVDSMQGAVRLKGEVRHHDTHENLPWETPRSEGHYIRGLEAVCRAASVLRPAR